MTQGDITVTTAKGRMAVFLTRNDTNDAALVAGVIGNDEYLIKDIQHELTGWAIDIGAHIGSVAVCLAIDYPDLRVIAVEAVTENVYMLQKNVAHNRVADRVTVVRAAATAPGKRKVRVAWNYRSAGDQPEAYVKDSRYIANIYQPKDSDVDVHDVRGVSLDQLMKDIPRLALLKIDCEGCEWDFLRSPRVADVDLIVGEFHNEAGLEGLKALIGDTHKVSFTGGHFDIGRFWAVRK